MTSCTLKIRASGPGQGKPVLISIWACSLGFHAINLERSTFTKFAKLKNQASVALNLLVSLFCCPVASGAENVVTDKQTDRHTH